MLFTTISTTPYVSLTQRQKVSCHLASYTHFSPRLCSCLASVGIWVCDSGLKSSDSIIILVLYFYVSETLILKFYSPALEEFGMSEIHWIRAGI